MSPQLVIFDVDGTLADTFSLFLDVFDQAAARFGFMPFDRDNLDQLRGQSAKEILRYHKVPSWRLPAVGVFARSAMEQRITPRDLFPGIPELIEAIAHSGMQLAILSSSSHRFIAAALGPTLSRFLRIDCGISLFGKPSRLKKLLASTKTAPEQALYIGDEVRDLEAARQCSVPFGAVSWGYTHSSTLLRHGADHIFSTPEEIAATLIRPPRSFG
jgi:phosphoglycolate phosphatase